MLATSKIGQSTQLLIKNVVGSMSCYNELVKGMINDI